MSTLEQLWDHIDKALETQAPNEILEVFYQAMNQGDTEESNQQEFYYAAGYVAYMYPEGKLNARVRKLAARAFLLSLFHCPSFLPSVLYLSFIKMDEMEFLDALALLYSCDKKVGTFDEQLIDRYVEATVCCLIECNFWNEALRQLNWFDLRMTEDAQVGIDLINFMKIIEKVDPVTELEKNVVKKIEVILRGQQA